MIGRPEEASPLTFAMPGSASTQIEIVRDDLNVFDDSPSAIVFTARGRSRLATEDGPVFVEGDFSAEIDVILPLETARQLRDALSDLVGGAA